ncbi:alpha/beta hydrolase [bacterium]|nr:alpha/beta hydrolase [bacterium]
MSASSESLARALLSHARRRTLSLPGRGIETALLDWGGDGPLALLHHANGFCKGTWAEVADALRDRFRVVALDARGHGDSSRPEGAGAYDWPRFAEDLVAVAEALVGESRDGQIALGIGHSFGGTAMIGAAARRPGLFSRLLLVDPVVPPPPGSGISPANTPALRRLVEGARRRRAHWPSRAAARAYCRERRFFTSWRPTAIELYLLDGMREHADGSLELKCPGAVEAAVFGSSDTVDVFALAAQVSAPALVLWAERGDFPRPIHEALARTLPAGRFRAVPAGHLVPMENPALVVDAVDAVPAEPTAAGDGGRADGC